MTTSGGSTNARLVGALARADGRRLLTHPLFLAGAGLAAVGSVDFLRAIFAGPAVTWDDDGWTVSVGFLLMGVLTMLATNHAALRDRRSRTTEQHRTMPAPLGARTGGLLTSATWPAAAAAAMLAVVVTAAAARGAVVTEVQTVQLLDRVVGTLMLGVVGVTIATWLPQPFLAALVAWAVVFVTPGESPAPWHVLTPFASLGSVRLAALHVGYVTGVTAVLALSALARHVPVRHLLLPAGAALSVVVVTGALMVRLVCPESSPCLL